MSWIPLPGNKVLPTVSCIGCDEGGVLYNCKPGTGKGSKTCDDYMRGEQLINDVVAKFNDVRFKVENIEETIKKPFTETKEKLEAIKGKFTIALPDVQIPNLPLQDISCGVKVPVINKSINPCELLNTPIKASTDVLNKGLGTITGQINKYLKELTKVFDPILDALKKQLQDVINDVQKPWMEVQIELNTLRVNVVELITIIRKDILTIIIHKVFEYLNNIIPVSPTTLIILIVIFFVIQISGAVYGFITLIKDLVGLIYWLVRLAISTPISFF